MISVFVKEKDVLKYLVDMDEGVDVAVAVEEDKDKLVEEECLDTVDRIVEEDLEEDPEEYKAEYCS